MTDLSIKPVFQGSKADMVCQDETTDQIRFAGMVSQTHYQNQKKTSETIRACDKAADTSASTASDCGGCCDKVSISVAGCDNVSVAGLSLYSASAVNSADGVTGDVGVLAGDRVTTL